MTTLTLDSTQVTAAVLTLEAGRNEFEAVVTFTDPASGTTFRAEVARIDGGSVYADLLWNENGQYTWSLVANPYTLRGRRSLGSGITTGRAVTLQAIADRINGALEA